MSINCIEPGGNKIEAGLDDLDELQAKMSGPVIITAMTQEDIAKYGPPKLRQCPECKRELPVAAFNYLHHLKRRDGFCRECRAEWRRKRGRGTA